ncbi:hypothetical protein [Halarcobacter sp.]|uniref:hypothetical protein n=1 Tax=Halarcobacter sp. TaxID=2321133 RepID=UPI002AA8815C|nr:hypothetical protein [Halarcobacter sp.]
MSIQTIILNSDTLFVTDFISSSLEVKSLFEYWKFTPAPAYFPDVILYFFTEPLFHNAIANLFIVSLVQLLLLVFFTHKIILLLLGTDKNGNTIKYTLFFYAVLSIIFTNNATWFLHQNNNVHASAYIFSLINLYIIMKFVSLKEINNISYLFVFYLINVLALISTKLFMLVFFLPVLLTLIFFIFKKFNKKLFIVLIILILSFITYYLVKDLIILHNPLNERTKLSLDRILITSNYIFKIFVSIYEKFNMYYATLIIGYLISFIYLIINRQILFKYLNKKKYIFSVNKISFILIFFIFLICINILGVIISGGLSDLYGFRYFILLPILLYIISITIYLKYTSKNRNSIFFIFAFLLIFVYSIIEWKQFITNGSFNERIKSSYEFKAASCINKYKEKINLRTGLSDYWSSRGVKYFLESDINMIESTSNLDFQFWMNSIEPIIDKKKFNTLINFIFLNNHLDKKNILKLVPKGFKYYQCENLKDSGILFYDNNIFDDWIYTNIYYPYLLNNNFINSFELKGKIFFREVGRNVNDNRVANHLDGSGYAMFGPYQTLNPGKYLFRLNYIFNDKNNNKPSFDIILHKGNTENILFKGSLSKNTQVEEEIITIDESNPFEFRIFYNGSGELTIKSLSITKIKN